MKTEAEDRAIQQPPPPPPPAKKKKKKKKKLANIKAMQNHV